MPSLQPCHLLPLPKKMLIILCLLLFAGCAAKSDRYDVPLVPLPERYLNPQTHKDASLPKNSASQLTPSVALNEILSEWWRIMKCPELDILMDRVLANNHDLRIATLRIAQTQARLTVAGAERLPEISLPARVETEAPANGIGTLEPGGKRTSRTTTQVSLRADWRPDIWGEQASLYESAEFQLWRATFQRDEVQRTVVSSAVVSYLEYLSLNDRLRVARETEMVLSEMLKSVEARLEKGDATVTEQEQQKAAVYAVRATIPVLEQQREVVANRLASLAGSIPGTLKLSDHGLNTITYPAVLPGVPSSYLLHRPDVRVVEARLLSADADIDVARARLFPPLDLTAQIGYGTFYLSQLFQPHTLAWNAIANLSATIFDNGKRSGEVKFAQLIHEEMVETYVRVIYDALREVEDAMSATRFMGDRLVEQQTATDSSRKAWFFSLESYEAGAVDYLVVLDTERTYHRNLDEWYNIRMERYRGLVNLFTSLGGGVPRGGVITGAGVRPLPLPSQIDSTLTASFDYGQVQTAAPATETALLEQGNTPALDVDVTATTEASIPPAEQRSGTQFSREEPEGIDWAETAFHDEAEYWLVEMAGLYDRSSVAPAWRDLRHRFPKQTESRALFPHLQGRVDGPGNEERTSWYRLFIAKFSDFDTAEGVCASLRTEELRCQVVSSNSLDWDKP